jgi:hypothetical protein
MKSKSNIFVTKKLNFEQLEELFETLCSTGKSKEDERLHWATEAMKEYLEQKKSESEVRTFSKIKALVDSNNGDISKFPAVQELFEYNIFPELNGLNRYIKYAQDHGKPDLYKIGRKGILEYIIACVENDPVNGDYHTPENKQLMIRSGQTLYKSGGMRDMKDGLVWSFIPKRYRREIDMYWDGIGEWRA